jgi:peptide/nickel transport system permease protein
MGGTTSMWADGQIPAADEIAPDAVEVASAKPELARAFVGRSPGRLALMRLRRDRTAVVSFWVLVFFVLVALLAPIIQWIYGYNATTANSALLDDNGGFPLGYLGGITFSGDNPSHHSHILGVEPLVGRDLFMQIVWGLRTSLEIAFTATVLGTVLGVVVGITAAYFGGWVDAVLSWIIDYMLAFPFFLFCLAVIPVINTRLASAGGCHCEVSAGKRVATIIVVFAGFGWMYTARLVRGQVLSLREREYVDAARAAGAPARHILFRQLLPNLWAPILVAFSLGVPATITAEAALSFLNIGVIEPTPDLGRVINTGANYIQSSDPMYLIIPGLLIFVLVLAFNLFGDALRDALDPRSSK